jgi:hypothetical protein
MTSLGFWRVGAMIDEEIDRSRRQHHIIGNPIRGNHARRLSESSP